MGILKAHGDVLSPHCDIAVGEQRVHDIIQLDPLTTLQSAVILFGQLTTERVAQSEGKPCTLPFPTTRSELEDSECIYSRAQPSLPSPADIFHSSACHSSACHSSCPCHYYEEHRFHDTAAARWLVRRLLVCVG